MSLDLESSSPPTPLLLRDPSSPSSYAIVTSSGKQEIHVDPLRIECDGAYRILAWNASHTSLFLRVDSDCPHVELFDVTCSSVSSRSSSSGVRRAWTAVRAERLRERVFVEMEKISFACFAPLYPHDDEPVGLQDGFLLAYNENGNVWIDMHFELVSDPRWLSEIPPSNRGIPEWMEDEMNSHVGVVRCMLSDDIVWSSSLDSVEVRGSVVVMTFHDSCLVALIHADENDYYPSISPVRLVHSDSILDFFPSDVSLSGITSAIVSVPRFDEEYDQRVSCSSLYVVATGADDSGNLDSMSLWMAGPFCRDDKDSGNRWWQVHDKDTLNDSPQHLNSLHVPCFEIVQCSSAFRIEDREYGCHSPFLVSGPSLCSFLLWIPEQNYPRECRIVEYSPSMDITSFVALQSGVNISRSQSSVVVKSMNSGRSYLFTAQPFTCCEFDLIDALSVDRNVKTPQPFSQCLRTGEIILHLESRRGRFRPSSMLYQSQPDYQFPSTAPQWMGEIPRSESSVCKKSR